MDFEGKQQSLLTFRVGPVLCCAPSLPVRSIITPPKLTHPPGSDASQPGIFKHGSHIVKVLDLRQKFGIDEAEQTKPGNLIITIFEKESFAFWVDQILDVFDFPSEGWGNLPAAIPRGVFTRTLLLNKKIHLYSEFEKLATIQDLGYLKHYIQQLKEQSDKKDGLKKIDTPSTLKSSIIKNEPVESAANTFSSTSEVIKHTSSISATNTSESVIKQTATNKSSPTSEEKNHTNIPIERRVNARQPTQNKTKADDTSSIKKIAAASFQNNIQSTTDKSTYTPTPTQSINIPATNAATPVIPTPKTQDTIEKIKPTIQTSQPRSNAEQANKKESSSRGILFFFFIVGLLGTGFYFLLPENITSRSKYEIQKTEDHAEFIAQPIAQEPDETPEIIFETKPVEPEPEPTNSVSIENDFSENTTSAEEINPEPSVKDKTIEEENLYRADISKQDNEITITLHQPLSSVETTIEKEPIVEIKVEQKIEPEIKEEPITDVSTVAPLNVKQLPPPIVKEKIINEVIHTVVKGDTLWAIAKKYVNNPFLYPELARLSNIKNPHRIYPGNRVRIRFINK